MRHYQPKANYPDTIQFGDVTKWREWDIDWSVLICLLAEVRAKDSVL